MHYFCMFCFTITNLDVCRILYGASHKTHLGIQNTPYIFECLFHSPETSSSKCCLLQLLHIIYYPLPHESLLVQGARKAFRCCSGLHPQEKALTLQKDARGTTRHPLAPSSSPVYLHLRLLPLCL